ncbi:MAG: protein-glutamate O-methyltransferase CheR [Gammaproteobacteria bacterium]|nr:MAG: protein-glutamate O-methyltransferase CheR [Gammaproteobacteria bacterium]
MSLPAIEQLLKHKMGLHSSTVGSSTVAQAVEQRMRDCSIKTVTEYRTVVSQSATEMNALIDTVVIPETWFYRDRSPFTAFSDWVKQEWVAQNPAQTLRILSIPCSTGEEPYTLAMCLADCDIASCAAKIDAIDISNTNIERARRAQYGSNSFRGSELSFRNRYFDPVESRYQLSDDIRSRVHFEQANIFDNAFSVNRAPYHVIFCRNLLIYFDRPTQHLAIDRLERLMTENTILFLGHSETSLLLERPFVALDVPRSFGFRRIHKTEHQETATAPRSLPKAATVRKLNKPAPAAPLPFADSLRKNEQQAQSTADEQDTDLLQQAFLLADQGHLDEAANFCETLLKQQTQQAGAHYLLGLIREAAGNPAEAERMFRKAIYLNPNHYEALAHLSVICRRQGDAGDAQRFHERATRAQRRSQGAGG